MKITSTPPKTGEEFAAIFTWSDGQVDADRVKYQEETDQFIVYKDGFNNWESVQDDWFNHRTIVVNSEE